MKPLLVPLLATILIAAPALAQTPAPADAARLVAAHALVDELFPPEHRDAVMAAMMKPQIDRMREAIAASPELQPANSDDPRAHEILTRVMDGYFREALTLSQKAMPRLMDAMTAAYARLFSVTELDQVRAFYATPAGRAFMRKQPNVLADPSVAAVQRQTMTELVSRMPAMAADIKAELDKLARENKQ